MAPPASLDAMHAEGCTIALVAQVSCGIYAGKHQHQINKQFKALVQDIVECRNYGFDRVVIPKLRPKP